MSDKPPEDDSEMQPQIRVNAEGKRDDEWSQCLQIIAEKRDRAAFARLFKHFAPLVKAFAMSGSPLGPGVEHPSRVGALRTHGRGHLDPRLGIGSNDGQGA